MVRPRFSGLRFSVRRRITPVLLLTFAVSSATAISRAKDVLEQPFDVPAGGLDESLREFSTQSGQQVIVPTELTRGITVPGVHGVMSAPTALERLLESTPLAATYDAGIAAFAITRRSAAAPRAARHGAAVIVVGLAADAEQASRWWDQVEMVRFALKRRGLPAASLVVIPPSRDQRATREAFTTAVRALSPELEESWLILIGQSAPGRDGHPAFQVTGPRISTEDVTAAVKRLPGKRYVVLGTGRSGGYLEALAALPNVEAVAATTTDGELNEPRFVQMWANALSEAPGAPFREVVADAAARVERFYVSRALGQPEHAQLIDRASGQIMAVRAVPPSPSARADPQ